MKETVCATFQLAANTKISKKIPITAQIFRVDVVDGWVDERVVGIPFVEGVVQERRRRDAIRLHHYRSHPPTLPKCRRLRRMSEKKLIGMDDAGGLNVMRILTSFYHRILRVHFRFLPFPQPLAVTCYFITGASRGLGLEFVRQISESAGNSRVHIYAACRDPKKATQLQDLAKQAASASSGAVVVEPIKLEITSDEEAKVCKTRTRRRKMTAKLRGDCHMKPLHTLCIFYVHTSGLVFSPSWEWLGGRGPPDVCGRSH